MQNEREKLIELIMNVPPVSQMVVGRRQGKGYMTASHIADHLLANGVIVPPCKVGDAVYAYDRWGRTKEISTFQITNISIAQNKKGVWTKKYRAMWFVDGKTVDAQLNFEFEEIGKTVFLSREDAEKALKERSEGK